MKYYMSNPIQFNLFVEQIKYYIAIEISKSIIFNGEISNVWDFLRVGIISLNKEWKII